MSRLLFSIRCLCLGRKTLFSHGILHLFLTCFFSVNGETKGHIAYPLLLTTEQAVSICVLKFVSVVTLVEWHQECVWSFLATVKQEICFFGVLFLIGKTYRTYLTTSPLGIWGALTNPSERQDISSAPANSSVTFGSSSISPPRWPFLRPPPLVWSTVIYVKINEIII